MPKTATVSEYGVVEYVHHPLVKVRGLPSISAGDLIQFSDSEKLGLVLSFDSHNAQVMSFATKPQMVGEKVYPTGKKMHVRLSKEILGTVLNPLGRQLFDRTMLKEGEAYELDREPPALKLRRPITKTLHTGANVVDLLLPLAKGQREILAGDRETGKSNFALKLCKTQILEGNYVVYTAVSKRMEEVKRIHEYFVKQKLEKNLVVVASFPHNSASLISLTPHTGMTIAEYLRDQGNDVLHVIDDLSNHAKAYRELALLNRSFPGRDSYPGDMFYIHAKLLERAGCIDNPKENSDKKTVSITCLPIAETNKNDLTDYITSNLISITDGHLLFDTELFQLGRRPSINPSISVTRVGKQTQSALERELTRMLTTFFNKYEKIKSMTHFAAELTSESQKLLRRGNQLWAFLTETSDMITPKAIQIIFVAIIWHGWFVNVRSKSLITYRDQLSKQYYTDEKVKTMLIDLSVASSWNDLLEKTRAKQEQLIQLCQSNSQS